MQDKQDSIFCNGKEYPIESIHQGSKGSDWPCDGHEWAIDLGDWDCDGNTIYVECKHCGCPGEYYIDTKSIYYPTT